MRRLIYRLPEVYAVVMLKAVYEINILQMQTLQGFCDSIINKHTQCKPLGAHAMHRKTSVKHDGISDHNLVCSLESANTTLQQIHQRTQVA